MAGQRFEREVVLWNQGRRPVTLSWANASADQAAAAARTAQRRPAAAAGAARPEVRHALAPRARPGACEAAAGLAWVCALLQQPGRSFACVVGHLHQTSSRDAWPSGSCPPTRSRRATQHVYGRLGLGYLLSILQRYAAVLATQCRPCSASAPRARWSSRPRRAPRSPSRAWAARRARRRSACGACWARARPSGRCSPSRSGARPGRVLEGQGSQGPCVRGEPARGCTQAGSRQAARANARRHAS